MASGTLRDRHYCNQLEDKPNSTAILRELVEYQDRANHADPSKDRDHPSQGTAEDTMDRWEGAATWMNIQKYMRKRRPKTTKETAARNQDQRG
jgi:hypothetical protein